MKTACLVLLGAILLLADPAPAEPASDDSLPLFSPETFVPLDRMPEQLHNELPVYPSEAEEKGIEGTVYLKAYLDTTGTPTRVKVAKSSGVAVLDSAAITAGYKNRFTPGINQGRPVSVWVTYKVEFRLSDRKAKPE